MNGTNAISVRLVQNQLYASERKEQQYARVIPGPENVYCRRYPTSKRECCAHTARNEKEVRARDDEAAVEEEDVGNKGDESGPKELVSAAKCSQNKLTQVRDYVRESPLITMELRENERSSVLREVDGGRTSFQYRILPKPVTKES